MTDRRKFIKTSSYLAAGAMLLPYGCTTQKKMRKIKQNRGVGVQVHSVRDALQEDFAGTMQKLSEIGYKYIEAYGMGTDGMLFGMNPGEYKKIVEDLGMELVSSHSTYFTPDQAPQMIEASKEAGLKYHIVPYLVEDLRKDYHAIAENLNKVGEMFNAEGIKFGYHNHNFEFEKQGKEIPMEILLKETDPEWVTFEADLYWVKKGGMDPMDLINKYPGRFSLFHVKDANEALEQTTLGTGIIDFKTILSNADKAGLEYYFVEDERTDDPLANMKANFEYISNLEY